MFWVRVIRFHFLRLSVHSLQYLAGIKVSASCVSWVVGIHLPHGRTAVGLSAWEVPVCLIPCHEAKVKLGGGRSKRSPASNQRRGSACQPCPPVHMPGQHSASFFPPSVAFCVLVTLLMLETVYVGNMAAF